MPAESKPRIGIGTTGAFLSVVFAAIAILSPRFALGTADQQRPIVLVYALFGIAFALYLFAIRQATHQPVSAARIMAIAILFRIIMLASTPILEIDVYRYIWDGNAVSAGVNPYEFSPQEVLDANEESPADLRRLADRAASSSALKKILRTVHFGNLPSPYPPVSQAVFAVSASVTPDRATVETHLLIMRLLIVLFDLSTLWLLMLLLRRLSMPIGWAVAYGWCPLVLKEFANSGHLDSITVFFTIAAAYVLVRAGSRAVLVSAILLATATAGKFYPLVLVPVFAVTWARLGRQQANPKRATMGVAVYSVATCILLFPMFADFTSPSQYVTGERNSDGIHAFIRYWEMNDFLFMLAIENLRPDELVKSSHPGWFVFIPNSIRANITSQGESLGLPRTEVPFLAARLLTVLAYGLIVLWTCLRLWRAPSAPAFLRSCFASLAWLWLLSPTLNPWYWAWSMAFIPFAVRREWLWVAGLAMTYYLRFWFQYHYGGQTVLETPYQGVDFFDYVVTCIEFGPWLILFWFQTARRRWLPMVSLAKC